MSVTRSIRETAEDIARRGVPYSWLNNEDEYRSALNWFANEIEQALRNERERAAKIAETSFEEFQTGYNAGKWIAAAIRKDD